MAQYDGYEDVDGKRTVGDRGYDKDRDNPFIEEQTRCSYCARMQGHAIGCPHAEWQPGHKNTLTAVKQRKEEAPVGGTYDAANDSIWNGERWVSRPEILALGGPRPNTLTAFRQRMSELAVGPTDPADDPERRLVTREELEKRQLEAQRLNKTYPADAMVGIGGGPTRATILPHDAKRRKDYPIASGLLDYFPDALAEVSRVSKVANDQHNPGEPVHWARGKSTDHADTLGRHLLQRGTVDKDGIRHSAKVAWRALAMLQEELEAAHQCECHRYENAVCDVCQRVA